MKQISDKSKSKEHSGIVIAGNILTDRVKVIDKYPDRHMLANIYSVTDAVGGCVPNGK